MSQATRGGSRKRVNVDKTDTSSVASKPIDDRKQIFSALETMENRLRIAALSNEIVRLCEETPAIGSEAIALAKELQLKLHFAIASDVSVTETSPPETTPEKWLDRKDRTETPLAFILRVYKDYLGKGLSRPDIRRLDAGLYQAFYNWKAKGGALPPDFNNLLPTRRLVTDAKLKEAGMVSGEIDPKVQKAIRLYHVVRRRRREAKHD